MIRQSDIRPVGRFLKTHGVGGELVAAYTTADAPWEHMRCLVVELDGIPVPFFIENDRPKGAATDLLKLADIDTEAEAAALCGHTIHALKEDLDAAGDDDADGFYIDDLVGYEVESTDGTLSGRVDGFDDSTENVLLSIDTGDRQVLVPAVDEFIAAIDPDARRLTLDLPPGLVE